MQPSLNQYVIISITLYSMFFFSFKKAEEMNAVKCQTGSSATEEHLKTPFFSEEEIFKAGTDGYHTFRIPSIIKTKTGALIAFCEGRKNNREDYGDIDLVARKSIDNGTTWGNLFVIWDNGGGTCGNPTPVLDSENGTIWLFMSYNDEFHNQSGKKGYDKIDAWGDRRLFSIKSVDDGMTWTDLTDRTNELVPPDYTWDAVGPGNGIQLESGNYAGRLIIPACGRNIFSDDHGLTWQYQLINSGTCEGTIVELCNGNWMRNDRAASRALKADKRRQISVSADNGITWSPWTSNQALMDPICQASFIRYNTTYPSRLLFINPATKGPVRSDMTVKISYDEGETWPVERLINSSSAGYSSVTSTKDDNVASLQEFLVITKTPTFNISMSIYFRKFNMAWILNGSPEPVQ